MWKDDKREGTAKQSDRSDAASTATEEVKAPVRRRRFAILDEEVEEEDTERASSRPSNDSKYVIDFMKGLAGCQI